MDRRRRALEHGGVVQFSASSTLEQRPAGGRQVRRSWNC